MEPQSEVVFLPAKFSIAAALLEDMKAAVGEKNLQNLPCGQRNQNIHWVGKY